MCKRALGMQKTLGAKKPRPAGDITKFFDKHSAGGSAASKAAGGIQKVQLGSNSDCTALDGHLPAGSLPKELSIRREARCNDACNRYKRSQHSLRSSTKPIPNEQVLHQR